MKLLYSEINDAMLARLSSYKCAYNIVSGEGENGTVEKYTGKLTARAIKTKLTQEESGGDRWAFLQVIPIGE